MKFLRRKINPSGASQKILAKIINTTKNTVLAERAEIADSFWLRLKGLLGRRQLEPNTGLILNPCNSIHTFFMRFSIDAAFVDSQNKIIKVYHALPAWRLSAIFFNSVFCIELPAETLLASHAEVGDYIQVVPLPI
jgi:uncharacterized membrane protein (UPF0127 family)